MQYQLRRFSITPGRMGEFIAAWTSGVLPLRDAAGFVTVGAWSDGDEFTWVLAFDGDLAAADGAYYASADRRELDPDPAQWIEASEETMVDRIV